jgi:WD40 repeat protein
MLVIETDLKRVEAVAFSPCGRFVAAGGLGVELWSVGLDRLWRWGWEKRPGLQSQYVRHVAFHPSGEWVYALVPLVSFHQLRAADGDPTEFRAFDGRFQAMAVLPDGKVVASSYSEMACWSAPPRPTGLRGERWAVPYYNRHPNVVAGLPSGRVVSHERGRDCWEFAVRFATDGQLESHTASGFTELHHLRASPRGRFLAAARNNTVRVWAMAHLHRPPRVLTNGTKKEITDLAFHPGGRLLATASNDRGVTLWDVETWQPTATFDWREGRMRSLAFSPDGLVAAAGGDDGQLVLFDVDG